MKAPQENSPIYTGKNFNFTRMNPRKLFLLDGAGALVSALMLGCVFTRYESFFGMPQQPLYLLAGIAAVFCVYSLACYLASPIQWRPFMKGIALANLLYCFVTIGCVIYHLNGIMLYGLAYFAGEVCIIVFLAVYELRIAGKPAI